MKTNLILHTLEPLEEQLKKYCLENGLDTILSCSKDSGTIFTIKIRNELSRNLASSLSKNIINMKEESFYAITTCKKNDIIEFSFVATNGMEHKFINNLLNFIKIIKLNKLFITEFNSLEEAVPIKMMQTVRKITEQKAPNLSILYQVSSKQIKIDNKIFSLDSGISYMNQIQNNTNYSTKIYDFNSLNKTNSSAKLANLRHFCKTSCAKLSEVLCIKNFLN